MSAQDASVLGGSAARIALYADFFEAYANTTLADLTALRAARPRGSDSLTSSEAEGVALVDDEEWTLTADAASALREAAHWRVVLDASAASNVQVGEFVSRGKRGVRGLLEAGRRRPLVDCPVKST